MNLQHTRDSELLPPQLRGIIGSKSGFIRYIYIHSVERGDPPIFASIPETADISYLTPGNEKDLSTQAAGKGFSLQSSLMSSIGEALERYCTFSPDYDEMIKASYRELEHADHELPRFKYLDLYTESQYEGVLKLMSIEQYDKNSPIWWCTGRNILTGEETDVPSQLVYMERNDQDPVYFVSTSNGAAGGSGFEDALLNSIYECVERDAFMRTWYSETVPPRVDLENLPQAKRIKERLENEYVRYHVVELDNELEFYTLGCAAVDVREQSPKFIIGAAASLDPAEAAAKALIEAAQGLIGLVEMERRKININAVLDFEDNVLYYARPENFEEVRFLLQGEKKQIVYDDPSTDDELRESLLRLDARDVSPIAFDLTTTDVREMGIHVTKMYIPELISLHLPAAPPLKHPQLREIDVTDKPHPFP